MFDGDALAEVDAETSADEEGVSLQHTDAVALLHAVGLAVGDSDVVSLAEAQLLAESRVIGRY